MKPTVSDESRDTADSATRGLGQFPELGDLAGAENLLAALASVFFPAGEGVAQANASELADETRLEVRDRYRILVEQIPAVVFMAYLDGGVSEAYVSPQIETLLGYTQEEWLNDPVRWYRHVHPEDKGRWSVEAAEMFLTGKPLRSVYRVLARDGRIVWFHCEARMVRDASGRPWFIHGVAFDVTDLKTAEEALRTSEHMLRGLFESAPDSVIVVDRKGLVERASAQVAPMFGYEPEELVGKPVEFLMPERFRHGHMSFRDAYLASPHMRPMGAGLELHGLRKDGSEFAVDVVLSPMGHDAEVVIAVIRDITNRKRAEAALQRREEELRKLTASLLAAQDEERRRIARDLHDGAAQNLAGLAMNLSMLMSSTTSKADANTERILSESLNLAEQCSREIRNLSYLLHPPLLDDLGLASALKSYIAGFIRRTGIDVSLEMPRDFGRLAPEVETALFRIVQEGLANVHRHSGAQQASIQISVGDAEVNLVVGDEGRGTAVGESDDPGGVIPGVGIPGMRERAQQLGGRMSLESNESGTRVTVSLPKRGIA